MQVYWFKSSQDIRGTGLSYSFNGVDFTEGDDGGTRIVVSAYRGVLVVDGVITNDNLDSATEREDLRQAWADDPLLSRIEPFIESDKFNSIWLSLLGKSLDDLLPAFIERNDALKDLMQTVSIFFAVLIYLKLDVRDFTEDDRRIDTYLKGFSYTVGRDFKTFLESRGFHAFRRGALQSYENDLKNLLLFEEGEEYLQYYDPNNIWVPSRDSLFSRQPRIESAAEPARVAEINKLPEVIEPFVVGENSALRVFNFPINTSLSYLVRADLACFRDGVEEACLANMQLTFSGDLETVPPSDADLGILYSGIIPTHTFQRVIYAEGTPLAAGATDSNGLPLLRFSSQSANTVNLNVCFADTSSLLISFLQPSGFSISRPYWEYQEMIFRGVGILSNFQRIEYRSNVSFNSEPEVEADSWLTVAFTTGTGTTLRLTITPDEYTGVPVREGSVRIRLPNGDFSETLPVYQQGTDNSILVRREVLTSRSDSSGTTIILFNEDFGIPIVDSYDEDLLSSFPTIATFSSPRQQYLIRIRLNSNTSGADRRVEVVIRQGATNVSFNQPSGTSLNVGYWNFQSIPIPPVLAFIYNPIIFTGTRNYTSAPTLRVTGSWITATITTRNYPTNTISISLTAADDNIDARARTGSLFIFGGGGLTSPSLSIIQAGTAPIILVRAPTLTSRTDNPNMYVYYDSSRGVPNVTNFDSSLFTSPPVVNGLFINYRLNPNLSGADRDINFTVGYPTADGHTVNARGLTVQPLSLPSFNVSLSGSRRLFLFMKNNNRGVQYRDILLYLSYYYADPNLSISDRELRDVQVFFLLLENDCFLLTEDDCRIII